MAARDRRLATIGGRDRRRSATIGGHAGRRSATIGGHAGRRLATIGGHGPRPATGPLAADDRHRVGIWQDCRYRIAGNGDRVTGIEPVSPAELTPRRCPAVCRAAATRRST